MATTVITKSSLVYNTFIIAGGTSSLSYTTPAQPVNILTISIANTDVVNTKTFSITINGTLAQNGVLAARTVYPSASGTAYVPSSYQSQTMYIPAGVPIVVTATDCSIQISGVALANS